MLYKRFTHPISILFLSQGNNTSRITPLIFRSNLLQQFPSKLTLKFSA